MSQNKSELPPTRESEIDSDGIKTVTSWKWGRENQLVKVVRKIKMERIETPILKRVLERSRIIPFGLPSNGNGGVTTKSNDDIFMEKSQHGEEKKEGVKAAMTGGISCRYCKGAHLSMKCPNKELLALKQQRDESGDLSGLSSIPEGKYVPPSMRRSGGANAGAKSGEFRDEDEGISIRISNVADDVDEYHLRDMFGTCGHLTKMRIICDFTTKKSRGFAFANYGTKEEADKAIAIFNGYALNHLILSVSIAEKRKTTAPRYATGYGKALPQNMRR